MKALQKYYAYYECQFLTSYLVVTFYSLVKSIANILIVISDDEN